MDGKQFTIILGLAACMAMATLETASARVQLESICTVYGQRKVELVGYGLVVGLKGTGDGGKFPPAVNALASALTRLNAGVGGAGNDLKDTKNVALVLISATVPGQGLRRGQHVDCYVSSVGAAKSLRGGRLLTSPLLTANQSDGMAVATAGGPIIVEDKDTPTSGRIPSGAMLEQNFNSLFIDHTDKERGPILRLLLDERHTSYTTAFEVAEAINSEDHYGDSNSPNNGPRTRRKQLATAVAANEIEVMVPTYYGDDYVGFVADVLSTKIDLPDSQARVSVNTQKQIIVITGDVEISPVVIRSKSLTVVVGGQAQAGGGFVSIPNANDEIGPRHLKPLVDALNQLQAPTSEIIDIIRDIHRTGKLHATYEER